MAPTATGTSWANSPDRSIRKTEGVIAVDRALSILDALAASKGPLTLAELSRACDLVKPTVLRSLVSLEKGAYVLRLQSGSYQLGSKAFKLGASYARSFNIEIHAMPVLRDLANASGESASFNIRDGNTRICLFKVDSPQLVRAFVDVRAVTLVDGTSTGMSLNLLELSHLQGASRPVFATSGINHAQLASVSTPVFDAVGKLSGALTLSGPVDRFGPSHLADLSTHLARAAEQLTSAIGGQTPPPPTRLIHGAAAI